LGNWCVAVDPQRSTSNDIALCSVRSWDKDATEVKAQLAQFHSNGWLIVLFASRTGMPAGVEFDHFIDNGASTSTAVEGSVNLLANETACWTWTCEFVAALTRGGKHPGIYKSAFYPDEEQHNIPIRQNAALFACETPVPAGQLAGAYLDRVDRLVADLSSPATRSQIDRAADLIARRLADGRRVGVTSCGHTLPMELFLQVKSPFVPFYCQEGKTSWEKTLKPGDLVVWFGYIGLSTKYEPYGQFMSELKLDVISCFVPDPDPGNNTLGQGAGGKVLAHIDQHWQIGDAEVPIPFAPGKMAPVSGIDQVLLFRLLDEAVAVRLARAKP
jgi:hypothetical protein